MNKKALSKKEWELLEILKQRKKLEPEGAENIAVGIILAAGEIGNVDKTIEFCNSNLTANLTDILNFVCKDVPPLEVVEYET